MTDCSALPAVIDALVTALSPLDPATCRVFDGPFDKTPSGDFLCVGWSPFDDTAASGQGQDVTTAGGRNEEFDVPIYVSTYRGATWKALRDRAKTIGDDVATYVTANRDLGGVIVGWAYVAGAQWYQQPAEAGKAAGLVLHIRGTARI